MALGGRIRAGAAVVPCVLAFLLATGCSRTPPEARLREAVATLQAGIEKRDPARIESVLADDFIGPEGLDRAGARRLAQAMFLRHRNVGVGIGPLDVDIGPERASVRFTAALTGGAGVLPERGQVYEVDTGWRLKEDQWRLVNARWTPRL